MTYIFKVMLADAFENFRNKCIDLYKLDPAHFLSPTGLAWQACIKKTEVELELLTRIDMLLMAEKSIRGRTYTQYTDMLKQIRNIWKIMMKKSFYHTSCI